MQRLSDEQWDLIRKHFHSMLTLRPLRHSSTRIGRSAPSIGSVTGTKLCARCTGSGTLRPIAIGALPRSAFRTQLRNRFAFNPRANATAAIDTPSCWHAPTASALNSSLWRRRRRRPVDITSLADMCTPPRLAKVHPYARLSALRRCDYQLLTFIRLSLPCDKDQK